MEPTRAEIRAHLLMGRAWLIAVSSATVVIAILQFLAQENVINIKGAATSMFGLAVFLSVVGLAIGFRIDRFARRIDDSNS